eukprot:4056097-Prymnesium_polylepis.1
MSELQAVSAAVRVAVGRAAESAEASAAGPLRERKRRRGRRSSTRPVPPRSACTGRTGSKAGSRCLPGSRGS